MCANLNKLNDIEKVAKIWQIELNMEYLDPAKNVRLSFKDIGPFCEYLAVSLMPGYTGGGSGGMGFDLINKKEGKAIEVKSCCTIQNAKCANRDCRAKFNDLFYTVCPECNGTEFYQVDDSRFSINASETLDEIKNGLFAGFVFCHVYKVEQDVKNKNLKIKACWYKLIFDDELKEIKMEYFKNQAQTGRKATCNLLPNSFDFYKLCPHKIQEIEMDINYGNLNKKPKVKVCECDEYPAVPIDVLRVGEQKLAYSLNIVDEQTKTINCKVFTQNIPYRNKSLGKERGDTRTNKYRRIKRQN